MTRLLAIAGLLAMTQPVFAQTALDTDFTISVPNGSDEPVVESTTLAPLLDGTCFAWHIKLGKTKGAVETKEVYTLPAAPQTWGLGDDSSTTLSKDRRVATTSYTLTPVAGWISQDWCVSAGDPVGPYSFDIYAGDRLLHHFAFEVEYL